MKNETLKIISVFLIIMAIKIPLHSQQSKANVSMILNKLEYLEYQGVNVMLAHDFYPEGHQGGVGILQRLGRARKRSFHLLRRFRYAHLRRDDYRGASARLCVEYSARSPAQRLMRAAAHRSDR